MLAILPEQVKMDAAIAEYPPEQPEGSLLSMEGKLSFAWATRDLSKSGVVGDPTVATKEKGDSEALLPKADRILESVSDGWVQVIKDVYAFQKPQPE